MYLYVMCVDFITFYDFTIGFLELFRQRLNFFTDFLIIARRIILGLKKNNAHVHYVFKLQRMFYYTLFH
jgi:hypothetical protein